MSATGDKDIQAENVATHEEGLGGTTGGGMLGGGNANDIEEGRSAFTKDLPENRSSEEGAPAIRERLEHREETHTDPQGADKPSGEAESGPMGSAYGLVGGELPPTAS